MKGIGLLGLTTAVFWLVVAANVTTSFLEKQGARWWEGEGSPYGGAERGSEAVEPEVDRSDVYWLEM